MRFIAMKLLRLVVVLLIVTFLSFVLIKLIPGNPVDQLAPFSTAAQKKVIGHQLGIDKPFFAQYWHWLSGFCTGNFGRYYTTNGNVGSTVGSVLAKALPVSALLVMYTVILTLVVSIPFGVVTAYKAGSRFDGVSNFAAFALFALPNFVLALLLAIYVGAEWKLLPTQWTGSPDVNPMLQWRYAILPVVSLAGSQIAIYMRLLRTDMIATLQEDFITTAKAKGIPTWRVLWRHALRPSSLTLLTVAGLNIGSLIGGAVVIETIFNLPGVGTRITQAIFSHQYVALQTYVAIIAIIYVVVNFIVDMLYSVIDPRIRNARALA